MNRALLVRLALFATGYIAGALITLPFIGVERFMATLEPRIAYGALIVAGLFVLDSLTRLWRVRHK